MATWSISVSSMDTGWQEDRGQRRMTVRAPVGHRGGGRASTSGPEQRDPVLADPGPPLGIVDAEAFGRRQAEHADLALVLVAVDAPGGDADLGERVYGRQQGLDPTLRDQPVGGVGLGVVGEVAGDQPL